MENSSFFEDEASEASRELSRKAHFRYLAALFLKLLWTSLTTGALLGLLLPLTVFLGWSKFFLSCLLGFLTGIVLAAGVLTSPQNRAMITLLLGVLTLPALAVYTSFMAASGPRALDASSSALMPFVAYATASLIEGLIIARIWRHMPAGGSMEQVEKEPVPGAQPASKEQTSHERSDLNKAA
jgi:hypothetical protein